MEEEIKTQNQEEGFDKSSDEPEIKTMRKDLARLRLFEAEKERRRILDLQDKVAIQGKITTQAEEKLQESARQRFEEAVQAIPEAPAIAPLMPVINQLASSSPINTPVSSPVSLTPEQRLAEARKRLEKLHAVEAEPGPLSEPPQPEAFSSFASFYASPASSSLGGPAAPGGPVSLPIKDVERAETKPLVKEEAPIIRTMGAETLEKPIRIFELAPDQMIPDKEKPFPKIILVVPVIVLLLAGGLAFLFLSRRQKQVSPAVVPPKQEEQVVKEQPLEVPTVIPEQPKEIIKPASLLSIVKEEMTEITSLTDLPGQVSQVNLKEIKEAGFTRILIKNKTENKFEGLKEFFDSFQVKAPVGLLDKLENDATFFVYSSGSYNEQDARYIGPSARYNRFGFAVRIKSGQDALSTMKGWELSMQNDIDGLLKTLGKTSNAPSNIFRQAAYKANVFRYLSLPQSNFGVCWAVMGDKLLFTVSGESMIKTMELVLNNK